MKIAILTEYRVEKGIGHLIRCNAIYNAFEEKDINVEFIVDTNEDIYILENISYIKYSWLIKGISKFYDVVLIDTYSINKTNWKNLELNSKNIFYLDDGNVFIPSSKINLVKSAIESKKVGKNNQFVGTSFFPLRRAIKETTLYKVSEKDILVMFGGTDIRELSLILTPIFKKYKNYTFNIVTANKKIYKKIIEIKNIKSYINPPLKQLLYLMKSSKFAIISGGTVLYELAYLQIPSIVIEVIDNQHFGIDTFKKRGFIEKSFIYNQSDLNEEIDSYIQRFISNYSFFKNKAKIGRKIIDGNGANRIVDEIMRVYRNNR